MKFLPPGSRLLRSLLLLLCLGANDACLAASLRITDSELSFDQQKILLTRAGKPVMDLETIYFNYVPATSWTLARADENEIVLTGTFPASAYFYTRPEDTQPRQVELKISKEAHGFRLQAAPQWAKQVTLEFNHLGDHFFGLSEPLQPMNRLSPDLTGASIAVDLVSEGELLHENYASAFSAFYMSTFGYGAFFDTFARGRYEFGINGKNRIHHDTGLLDWHIFPGNDGREIHAAYFSLIGQPKPVPAWGLGPMGWRDQNDGGAAEIVADIDHMSALRIPFTSWFVDRPYSDGKHGWSQLNFGKGFEAPGKWIARIRDDYGLEFMTWTTPATFGDARFNKHLPGKFTYLDLTDPQTVNAYQSELKAKQHAFGVKGHKIDRADEGFPSEEDWADSSVPTPQKRNRYTYLMIKTHDDVLRQSWGEDQFTFSRAAIHRTQPFLSAIWAGDPRTSWEGLQSNFANAARAAFMGFPVWGTDVGGYQGEGYIPQDLYIRWMQASSMAGLFEIKLDGAGGEGRDRMPWRYDASFQKLFRDICEDRMQLLPYLYSLAHTSGRTGTLMQPLAYRHPGDAKTYDIWDQFYLGDAILVAPVFTSSNTRSAYLPPGQWRDFDQRSHTFAGGTIISVDAPLQKLPRFIKENSLYVSGNIYRGNARRWDSREPELVIHASPGRNDSSTTFTYVDMLEGNAQKPVTLTRAASSVTVTAPAMTHPTQVQILLDQKPRSVTLNGKPARFTYDRKQSSLLVSAPAHQAVAVKVSL